MKLEFYQIKIHRIVKSDSSSIVFLKSDILPFGLDIFILQKKSTYNFLVESLLKLSNNFFHW